MADSPGKAGASRSRAQRMRRFVKVVALLVCGWGLYQFFWPDAPIRISRETTFITEPLTPEGLPDYNAYFFNYNAAGVTPENNAAVLVWEAVGMNELAPEEARTLRGILGMANDLGQRPTVASLAGPELRQEVVDWLYEELHPSKPGEIAGADHEPSTASESAPPRDGAAVDGDSADGDLDAAETASLSTVENAKSRLAYPAEDVLAEARERPWRTADFPRLARWIEEHREPLELLVEAADRERYWCPSPELLKGDQNPLAAQPPYLQTMREAARALATRAMWHVGEGRSAEAWRDLSAIHRLGRLVEQDATLVGQLVSLAIDGVANELTVTMLHHAPPDEALARLILAELTALGPPGAMATSLDQGERAFFLALVLLIAKHPDDASKLILGGPTSGLADGGLQVLTSLKMDWNEVLATANEWFDRITKLARATRETESHAVRQRLFEEFDAEFQQQTVAKRRPSLVLRRLVTAGGRTRLVSEFLLALLLPAVEVVLEAELRTETYWQMARMAAALAVQRAEQGGYPEQLTELVPGVLPELPIDRYAGEPFRYQRKPDGGYLLYSVFKNGKDDLGSSYSNAILRGEWRTQEQIENAADEDYVDYDESDLVLRLPVPPFALPPWPREDGEGF